MSSFEIKFQGSERAAKFYKGKPGNWPEGVYQCDSSEGTQTILRAFGTVIHISSSGKFLANTSLTTSSLERWCRVSNSIKIASITFAGSANYPDGKPEEASS